jgi:hypothetical protein
MLNDILHDTVVNLDEYSKIELLDSLQTMIENSIEKDYLQLHAREAELRIKAFDDGKIKSISFEEVFA